MSVIRPVKNASIAKITFDKVSKSSAFGTPVTLNTAQLKAFGKALTKVARANPEQASKLVARTIQLWNKEKIIVKSNALFSYGGRNEMALMTREVIQAIHKADPSVATPREMTMLK